MVRQPWATLIALGVKQIETRPFPPNGPMRPEGVRGLPGCSLERGERICDGLSRRTVAGVVDEHRSERSARKLQHSTGDRCGAIRIGASGGGRAARQTKSGHSREHESKDEWGGFHRWRIAEF